MVHEIMESDGNSLVPKSSRSLQSDVGRPVDHVEFIAWTGIGTMYPSSHVAVDRAIEGAPN